MHLIGALFFVKVLLIKMLNVQFIKFFSHQIFGNLLQKLYINYAKGIFLEVI